MFNWLKKQTCFHIFDLKDIGKTNIAELPKPKKGDGLKAWEKYFSESYKHPSITKRIKWPCCKCGKVFYGHCGLDILENGNIKKR